MKKARHLLQSTMLVMVLFGLNKVTGLVRLQLVGRAFGTSPEYDAFTAANQLPEVFFVLVAGGALAAAFIPVYTEYLNSENPKKVQESADLASTVFTLVLLVLIVVCGLGALFAPTVAEVLVPAFSAEKQALTASLMRIILINTTLFGVSGIISSLLNSHQHFILPAAAPIALDIGYFLGLFFLVPRFGVFGLAWGTVLAALMHIGIQLPALWRHRIAIRPKLSLKLDGVQEIARLMGPRIVMLGAIQASDLVIVRLGSGLPDGSISGYFYAWTLMQLPETLFGTAVAIVIFPTMSELYNAGKLKELKELAATALRIVWLLTIPSAMALILLGRPAIALVLERGSFDANSTNLVYGALAFLSIRLVSEATLEIVARLFYARHNTYTPMWAYLAWLVVNIVFTFALVGPMGIGGLALASTISFTFLAGLLFYLNQKELGVLVSAEVRQGLGRAVLSTVAMSIAILLIQQLGLSSLLFLGVAATVGGVVYLLTFWLLGGQELKALQQLALKR